MTKISLLKELLAQSENQEFIQKQLKEDIPRLLFKWAKDENKRLLIEQIASRQAIRKKLPSYFKDAQMVFPPRSNLEQSSSEAVARFRSEKLGGGKAMADLSAGFGVDFRFLAQNFEQADYIEPNAELLAISEHNLNRLLGNSSINYHNLSAEDFLKSNRDYFDLLFLDPSRRDADKRRLYAIEDYEPNLLAILPQLLEIADRVYVKLSPMISIAEYQKQLEHLSEVWLISERNECKEVGFLFQKIGKDKALKVKTWDIYPESVQHFSAELPSLSKCPLGELQEFIYLPNSSILKAGLQDQCANHFQLLKFDLNTNLYSSAKLLETFPGRKFKLLASHKPYASALKEKKLQVISRNFPDSPEKIQQKLKLNPKGAKDFLIATSLQGQAIFLECEWIFNSTISHGG